MKKIKVGSIVEYNSTRFGKIHVKVIEIPFPDRNVKLNTKALGGAINVVVSYKSIKLSKRKTESTLKEIFGK